MKSIAESEWICDPKVSVIYIDIDGADTEVIQGTIEQYSLMCNDKDLYYRGCEQIVFCHDADEKNEEVRYQYHFRSGKWGTISLPMIMLIDKNNIVREMLTGAQAADKILPVMNHVVEAGNAEEEDKKTIREKMIQKRMTMEKVTLEKMMQETSQLQMAMCQNQTAVR